MQVIFGEPGDFVDEHPSVPILKLIDFGETDDPNLPAEPLIPVDPLIPDDDSDESMDSMELKMMERDERRRAEELQKHDLGLGLAQEIELEQAKAEQIQRQIRRGEYRGPPDPL